jgi:cell division initiation protein
MKIGPVDIRNHTFNRKMRGVDEHEVRDYLDLVADRLEEVVLESDELRARIDQLEHEVRDHRALERSLRDSMLSAERLVDDRSAQAEKEAQIVIKNAEVQAGKILLQAREELARLHGEIDDLRRQKVTYVERFRALLRSQGKILEASLESFDPDAEPAAPATSGPPPAAAAPPVSPVPEPEPPRETGPLPGSMSAYVTRSPAAPPSPAAGPGNAESAPWQAAGATGQERLFGGENA